MVSAFEGLWVSSPKDALVADFSEATMTAILEPSDGVLRLPERTPISSQGPLGTCAATATCDGFEQIMEEPVQLSVAYVNWNAKRYKGKECDVDVGTDLFSCFNSLIDFGACAESLWPYDLARSTVRPSLAAYEQGFDQRLAQFYAIHSSGARCLDGIDRALHGGRPVVFGLRTNRGDLHSYRKGDVLQAPSEATGGHAMVIVGYEVVNGERVYRFRNSYSRSWGDLGYGLISPSYLAAGIYAAEFYVPEALPIVK